MSVGHIARLLEKAGMATVIIAIRAFRTTLAAMTLPRVLLTPNPLGRPLGKPHNRKKHKAAILAALTLLVEAKQVREVIELPGSY